jgi:hypothetical protein
MPRLDRTRLNRTRLNRTRLDRTRLEFSHRRSYAPGIEGIQVPAVLRHGGDSVDILASVDTGASNCLYEREHAELLGLSPEQGQLHPSRT